MKHHNKSKTQQAVIAPRPASTSDMEQNEITFALAPDEVAKKAYFAYENQGSVPGHDVQHWLAAEAELIAERNLTRIHGFHNKT